MKMRILPPLVQVRPIRNVPWPQSVLNVDGRRHPRHNPKYDPSPVDSLVQRFGRIGSLVRQKVKCLSHVLEINVKMVFSHVGEKGIGEMSKKVMWIMGSSICLHQRRNFQNVEQQKRVSFCWLQCFAI